MILAALSMDAGSLRRSREPAKFRNLPILIRGPAWRTAFWARKKNLWPRVRNKNSESKHKEEKKWLIQELLIWYAPRETMLNLLQAAWRDGDKDSLSSASFGSMPTLTDLAVRIMQKAISPERGNYAPCYRLV